jgi:hypothetical protein
LFLLAANETEVDATNKKRPANTNLKVTLFDDVESKFIVIMLTPIKIIQPQTR